MDEEKGDVPFWGLCWKSTPGPGAGIGASAMRRATPWSCAMVEVALHLKVEGLLAVAVAPEAAGV